MVKIDLSALEKTGYSLNHRGRVMPVLSSFCQWLIDKQEPLKPNLACCLERLAQQVQAPRVLSEKQRFILRALVEQAQDLMGDALFTLGYWAGYRMSDLVRTPVGPPRCAVTLLSSYKKLAGQWRREPASLACQAEETLALQTIARSTRVSQEKKGCTSIQIPAFYTSQA
jgi:site-specific recombinase XerC